MWFVYILVSLLIGVTIIACIGSYRANHKKYYIIVKRNYENGKITYALEHKLIFNWYVQNNQREYDSLEEAQKALDRIVIQSFKEEEVLNYKEK